MAPTMKQGAQLIFSFFVLFLNVVAAQDGFFFTIPKVLREKEVSEFCFTTYSSSGHTKNVTMSMINKRDPNIYVKVDDVYSPGVRKCNKFTVPEAEDYEVLLYNETDILHDSVPLTVRAHSQITLIQTDKPIYKPGQKVLFRILTLHSNQKPRTGMISAVFVRDPNESRVKQFLNIDSQGIASLEFQLSKEAKLGNWQISVFLNETDFNAMEDGMTSFEVKEYVLPRYEVTITPPKYVLAADDVVEGTVCAKYTYGKSVHGYLDLKVCGGEQFGYTREYDSCHREVVKMSGCYNFTANATALRSGHRPPFYGWQLNVEASVTEGGTGFVVNATHQGPSLTRKEVNLELKDFTNGFFKPGLPFHGKVVATTPDGQPARGELIRVSAFDYDANVRFAANFTSDESGFVTYSMCGDFGNNLTSLSIMAEALNYEERVEGMETPRANDEIKQWFSPSFSYIQIPRTEAMLKCGDNFTLSIPFTTKAGTDTTFKYEIISRGKVVTTGNLQYTHEAEISGNGMDNPLDNNCLLQEILPTPEPYEPLNPFIDDIPPPPPVEELLGDPLINPPEFTLPPELRPPSIDEVPIPPILPEDEDEFDVPPPPPIVPGEGEPIDVPPPPPILPDIYGPGEPQFKEPIVRSEFIADKVSEFKLEISVTTLMAPKFTLLIYHVLPDGEVVADSMEFNVEPCFDNDVAMTFNRSTVLPGEDVNVRLEGAPGSVCGLGIIDKSVNILGGNHQITMDTIFDKLEEMSMNHGSMYSYDNEREYCEERIKKFTDDETYWGMSSRYADAKQAFKSSGMIVMTDLKFETRPCEVSTPYVFDFVGMDGRDGQVPGPRVPVAVPLSKTNPAPKAVDIRSYFPETWLWDLQIVGENGSLDLPLVAPHTITSWVGNAVCMDADKGVGISPLQSLTTFQPFFIHLNLPYSAVRDERLPIMVSVHNYMDKCLNIKLTLDLGKAFKARLAFTRERYICVCPGVAFTTKFYATPIVIGSLPIMARAEITSGACNNSVDVDLTYHGLTDAVKRQILVKAEGVTKEYTHTMYMCANEKEASMEDVTLPLPEDIVKDSESGTIKVIGDIMGPALSNLDNLVRLPTGCGEQNMVGFTPNIFVLKYLSNTGLLTEKIQEDAVKFMEIGYQRELNYRHKDGSFSAFGERDERGSVWLTAFVVKSFAQATPYVFIDPGDIARSVRFLKRSQAENGCFMETGKVFSSYMMGGLGKRKSQAALTSYVLVALLQAGVNSSEEVITEGFKCINKQVMRSKGRMDVYSLALSAYANTLLDRYSKASIEIMKTLESKAKRDGNLKYWNREGVKPPPTNSWFYSSAPSAEVEMTAYALMAYLVYYGEGAIPHSHEIAMWLSHQRNPHGGFASTQDTVVGLNALSEFAIMAYKEKPTNVNVTVYGKGVDKTFHVSEKENTKLLVQSTPIGTVPNRLRIVAEGEGCALVQANVRFNKLPQNIGSNKPGFHLKVMPRRYRHDPDICYKRTINIAVGSRGNQKHSKGMSLVVVKLVTSWTPIKDSLVHLESQMPVLGIKRYEYDELEGVITFYFEEFRRKAKEFTLDVEQDREMSVTNAKAGQVSVINYYETDVAVIKSYTLKTICGTKLEIPLKPRPPPFDPRDPIPIEQRRVVINPPPPQGPRPQPPVGPALQPGEVACPICRRTKSIPAAFKDMICDAKYIYKAISGRKGTYPIKIRQNIRPQEKENVNQFTNFKLPDGCDCSLMTPPVNRIFIITSRPLDGKMLTLDSQSTITYSTRRMERALQKLKKDCPDN